MGTYRIERIGYMLQEKIGALILEDKIKDPRVHSLLSVTRVRVSRDLAFADVYISNIRDHGNINRAVEGLQSAAGFIQTELASFLRIRKMPRLRFHADTGIREGFDLVKKIEQLTGGGAEGPVKDDERQ
ncbi:MAG: 30S ribosome-binding factor RbfA [Treponema sp.]|nr:30S ribosome-binding factor RbfA [Treponema sp.]